MDSVRTPGLHLGNGRARAFTRAVASRSDCCLLEETTFCFHIRLIAPHVLRVSGSFQMYSETTLERHPMRSSSLTIRLSPIFLAVFLAIQVSPVWASTVKGIDVIVKCKGGKRPPCPSKDIPLVTTDSNGHFSVHIEGGAATYQVTAVGGNSLSAGTSVKLTFSVRSESATTVPATTRQSAPAARTATAVLDASGGLAFPGEIQVSERSVLTGHLEIDLPRVPAKEQGPAVTKPTATKK
jgi:hypothetical protein